MTREELIEAILEEAKKRSPEERKARRKKWAKRAALGLGTIGAGVAVAYYGPKMYHSYGQHKIRRRVLDNISRSQQSRQRGVRDPRVVIGPEDFRGHNKRKVGYWANEYAPAIDHPDYFELSGDAMRKAHANSPSWKSIHRHVRKQNRRKKGRIYPQYYNNKPNHPTVAGMERQGKKRSERVLYRDSNLWRDLRDKPFDRGGGPAREYVRRLLNPVPGEDN